MNKGMVYGLPVINPGRLEGFFHGRTRSRANLALLRAQQGASSHPRCNGTTTDRPSEQGSGPVPLSGQHTNRHRATSVTVIYLVTQAQVRFGSADSDLTGQLVSDREGCSLSAIGLGDDGIGSNLHLGAHDLAAAKHAVVSASMTADLSMKITRVHVHVATASSLGCREALLQYGSKLFSGGSARRNHLLHPAPPACPCDARASSHHPARASISIHRGHNNTEGTTVHAR